ncbi:MAG: sigma-70 family RNA polymerase sigma factor [Planctomycetota bacterium]|nr:sigma-70 family RNA polymerase sigma factor [Planctomycetota bacterium]
MSHHSNGQVLSEAEIVLGLRSGCPVAWDALCDRFGNRVWAFLVRLVGANEDVVGDLFQETFLAAFRSGRNLRVEGTRLWSWLAQITHNLAADHWRLVYRDRRYGRLPTEAREAFATDLEDPVARVFQGETVAAVRGVLAGMASDAVAVLVAKYVDGHSVARIVEEFGGTTESVRSRIARARRDFKSRFDRLSAERQSMS